MKRKLRIGLPIGITVAIVGALLMLSLGVSVTGSGEISISNSVARASPGVAYVRVTEGTSITDTLTLNIQSSGTDRVLVVGLAHKSNATVLPNSVVFNTSENFTLERHAADGGDAQACLYYLTNPTVTTADVVITMPAEYRMVGYVALFTGVDQTNPFTANTNEAQGVDAAPTVDVSSAADEIVIDILAQVSAGPDTATAAHTQICNGAATGGGTDTRGAGQYAVGQATRTMNWTMSDADNWNIIAGALQEPQAAPDITNLPTSKGFGTVDTSTDYWSNDSAPTWPLDDSECYFTVTNNSGAAVDIVVKATNFTGGVGWTLAGTPAGDTVTMKVGKSGDTVEGDMVTLTTGDQSFITGLPDTDSKKWELKFESATSHSDGDLKTSIVTLTASLS